MENRGAGSQSGEALSDSRPCAGPAAPRPGLLPALLAVVLIASQAIARPGVAAPVETIGGWEGDSFGQGYGFATLGALLDDGRSISFPVRVTGSYLYYEFEDDGATTRVRAPGAAGLIGIRSNGARATVTLTGGGEARWERRATESGGGFGGAVVRGRGVFEGTAELRVGRRLRPFLLGTYSGSARYLFGRAAIRWQCSNLDWSGPTTWNAGIEATGQGNADTDALQLGGILECAFTRARLSVGVHGGYKSSDSGTGTRRTGGYGGVSLYRRF